MNQAAKNLAAEIRANRNELAERLERLDNVIINAYVVRCEGLTLAFTVDPITKIADQPRTVSLLAAPWYSQDDARTLAAAVKNGNGTQAQAVHIKLALSNAIVECDQLINLLEGAAR